MVLPDFERTERLFCQTLVTIPAYNPANRNQPKLYIISVAKLIQIAYHCEITSHNKYCRID